MIYMLDYASFKHDEVATHHVSVWICNDGDLIDFARQVALGGPKALKRYVTAVLRLAPKNTAAWHVAQEIAPNDLERIDWQSIVYDLKAEES
jgi:hypothetical protein